MAQESTRKVLITLLDDIELLSKELFELATSAQANRLATKGGTSKVSQVLDALVAQNEKFHGMLKTAEEQSVVQLRIDSLNTELDKKNGEILSLQKSLKDAETVLASSVFDAKKKLASIKKAEEKAVTAEDLIRFAHRISSSGAVAAPPTWAPGDPSRRPYPTDTDMRQGLMAKDFDKLRETMLNQTSHSQASQSTPVTTPLSDSQNTGLYSYSFQAQSALDTPNFMSATRNHPMNIKQSNDVEIMSQSDTSSSSSSDEQ
ncbi:MED4 [Bugula neritina]|uniref:Mediator of RNA polymerase II transcription subunit 4 n=1 Tax=Bugula neritina TaxID=10212 RepID=A0A7J7KPC2_BUGNE|nr:MED4 [Bugula neritina]